MTLQDKLPIIVTVSQSGQQLPEGITTEMVGKENLAEMQLFAEVADELFNFEHRAKYFVTTPVVASVLNVDASRDHAITLKLSGKEKKGLLKDYYDSFHHKVKQACEDDTLLLGLDLHIYKGTAEDKTVIVCLGNNGDTAGEPHVMSGSLTCPTVLIRDFMDLLAAEFSDMDGSVRLNQPHRTGTITKTYHRHSLPWIRLAIPDHMICNRFHQLLTKRIEQLYNRIHAAVTFMFKVQGWLEDEKI